MYIVLSNGKRTNPNNIINNNNKNRGRNCVVVFLVVDHSDDVDHVAFVGVVVVVVVSVEV